MKIAGYGWRRDLPDKRDHVYKVPRIGALSQLVDLRGKMPTVYDQGQLGSCTANAIAGAMQYDMIRQGKQAYTPSRLFIYYSERVIEHTVREDAGAEIRDGAKSVNQNGACPETDWPYIISKFAKKPPKSAYQDASKEKVITYASVPQDGPTLQAALANTDVIVFGFTVYESFESNEVAQTGIVPMPADGEKVLGGHAVVLVGYSQKDQTYIVRNSWGSSWGQAGYFTLPFEYVHDTQLASDFWNLQVVQ